MITLAPAIFDIYGPLSLDEDPSASDLAGQSRRVSRTATLDGGAVLADYGYTDADRTLTVMADRIAAGQWTALQRLLRDHATLTLACREGLFLGAIEQVYQASGGVKFTFLPTEKLI